MTTSLLEGIRVVELATALQGPLAAQYLSDHGATVIKIEPPTGDASRFVGVYPSPGHAEQVRGSQFISANRGKLSVCLDLKTPFGHNAAATLVATADVFLTNLRQPALERLALDADTLEKRHPDLIYARATGFGPFGPDADKAMIDGAAQARGGITALSGSSVSPTPPGCMLADTSGALTLALGVLTGLTGRLLTGHAHRVDTSALGTQLYLQSWELQHAMLGGEKSTAAGAHHALLNGLYGVYQTSDEGQLFIGVFQEFGAWQRFWTFAGLPEVGEDQRWNDLAQQFTIDEATLEQLRAYATEAIAAKGTEEWTDFLAREPRIIWEQVRDFDGVFADPQNIANRHIASLNIDAHSETTPTVGNPVMVGGNPCDEYAPPPGIGDHTMDILSGVGISSAEINRHINHCHFLRSSQNVNTEGVQ
ncbi:fldA [Symbiodinium necroappetens]|uniref:FldA protein n=1 Tax=Symbiodinium necroappetens TaxID=1628268 RepID=A0A812ZR60_9DINO|nr:fldA [Symbiodinium necroappetens]